MIRLKRMMEERICKRVCVYELVPTEDKDKCCSYPTGRWIFVSSSVNKNLNTKRITLPILDRAGRKEERAQLRERRQNGKTTDCKATKLAYKHCSASIFIPVFGRKSICVFRLSFRFLLCSVEPYGGAQG